MNGSPIISTHELAGFIEKKSVRIIDCRFNLGDPDWGYENYLLGHIPGALYAHMNRDLSGQVGPDTGRHPLPNEGIFLHKLAGWGISPDVQVVVYDTVGGAFADRLWYMLRAIGHKNVRVLDGGLSKWQADGHPLSTGPEEDPPIGETSNYARLFDLSMLASTTEIEAALSDPSVLIVDARAPERYQGLQEPIDPVAGHIPGAVNRFHGENLTREGVFKPKEVLKKEMLGLIGTHPLSKVVVYCGSGVTSCHHLIAFELAGLSGARLYVGSWSEWIRDPKRPIALGLEKR